MLTTLGIMAMGGLIGSVVSAVSSAFTQMALTGTVNWKSVGVSAAAGFISGALAASPLGIGWQIIGGGAIGGAAYVADCYVNDKPINAGEARLADGMGTVSGLIGGPGANKNMVLTDAIEYMGKATAREARRANQQYATKAIERAIYYGSNIVSSSTWGASIRFAAGCGIANGVTGKASEANWYSHCITWEP